MSSASKRISYSVLARLRGVECVGHCWYLIIEVVDKHITHECRSNAELCVCFA